VYITVYIYSSQTSYRCPSLMYFKWNCSVLTEKNMVVLAAKYKPKNTY